MISTTNRSLVFGAAISAALSLSLPFLAGGEAAMAQQLERPAARTAQPAARPAAPAPHDTNAKGADITTGTIPAEPPAQPAAATTAAGQPTGQLVEVTGFRSAKFGMSEDEVRAAIVKDFKVQPQAIKLEENKLERTRMLTVEAPEALPGGGTATVSYIFGYETKKLIQAGLVWSKTTDAKMTPEQLYSNANILRAHFIAQGYKPDTVAMNMPVAGGLLMFRGSDAEGRTTLLVLQGDVAANENKQRVLTPSALSLFYVADAKKPDVYRLPSGLF